MYFRFKTILLNKGMQEKKKVNVTDPQKIQPLWVFFCFFFHELFIYSNIYVFIYLFIKEQFWMSALAAKT